MCIILYVYSLSFIHYLFSIVPQNVLWPPPDPDNVPLYFEDPSLRVTDTDLQDLLDAHLNQTGPSGFANKVFRTDTPDNEVLRLPGCQDLDLEDVYAGLNPTAVATAYLAVLSCDSNFAFRNASAYYYPPFIASTKCINSISNQET